ncbi:MAG: FAD:protein FMN transferase [Acidobacteria bacterium]|nr:FAD:protein FMN transferase [Acidobacteriota bacterium]
MPASIKFVMIWLTLVAALPLSANELIRFEESRVSMACTYTIVVYGKEIEQLRQIVNDALDEVDRIDRLMSHYKKESPLSLVNRQAASIPVEIDSELFDFLEECLRYSRQSDGAFDITVGPLMKAWGFFRGEGRMPKKAELSAALSNVGYRKVILDKRGMTVRFEKAGVELDLGGIAKGYAVDRVVTLLKERGIERALVSAGGSTIYGLGSPPDSAGWEIQVQDPIDQRKFVATISLNNRALSVSGSYEKFFEMSGVRYSHIMDPRTGMPVQGVLSVLVITGTGTAGDALDNVFYVLGVEKSRKLLESFSDTEVHFFVPDSIRGWKKIEVTKPTK